MKRETLKPAKFPSDIDVPEWGGPATVEGIRRNRVDAGTTGRILQTLGLNRECRCDASCLMKEFFGASGFDPGAESNDGFGVIA